MSTDVNRAMEHLRKLQKIWPDLYFHPQKETGDDIQQPAKLIGLHIVWPWSKELMKTLSPSVFCDATFELTVYHYKVVCISTLDGNNQLLVHNGVSLDEPKMYVVTTDQEKAIRGGLRVSHIDEKTVQFFCALHTRWNVRDHE